VYVCERETERQTKRASERGGEGGFVYVFERGVLLTPFWAPLLKTLARTGSVYVCVGETARERERERGRKRADLYSCKREGPF